MKRYGKYVKPYIRYFICGPLCMIVEVLGEIFLPWMMANIINIGVAQHNIPFIIGAGGLMVLMAILMACGGVGGAYFAAKAAYSFGTDLRQDLFEKIQEFSFKNIDDFSTGSLVTRLTNDITQIQNLITMLLRMCLRAPGMLIGALIMAFAMNGRLALIILIVIPLLALSIGLVIWKAFPKFNIMQTKIDRLNSCIQESLMNIRVIKSFVRGNYENQRFEGMNRDLWKSGESAVGTAILNMPIMTLAMNITTIAVVWYGGNMIIGGTMQVGDLTAFTTYIVQILMSLMMLSMVFLNSSRALVSVSRINEVLDTVPDLTDDEASQKERRVEKGDIEFKDVCFKYYKNSEDWVLSHISFRVKAGQTLGIIGGTGCGKTTLVSMLPRLYDVDSGEVLVDGVNVKEYSLYHLREGIGMVLQKNVLFSGTIMENLRWGDEEAGEEEVFSFARQAQADEFIRNFPKGYETAMGQGGVNVSGGQKQRLCIARALLKKPKILILDDSTSAVDTATEAKIRKAFKEELKDSTKILIAQRITSVMDADEILVLDEGKIAACGTHEELIKTCDIYRDIAVSQMRQEVSA